MFELELKRRMNFKQKTDSEILACIARGKKEGLDQLYDRHGKKMFAYALRLTSDAGMAEDVLQESLIAAWQGASRFRGEGRVIAWLLGIVHHKAMHALRSRQHLSFEELNSEPRDHTPLPDEQVSSQEQSRSLRSGLENLSLEHRMVLDLVFYQGLSLKETAEICGCPTGTVKSRLNYAKKALRGNLQISEIRQEEN